MLEVDLGDKIKLSLQGEYYTKWSSKQAWSMGLWSMDHTGTDSYQLASVNGLYSRSYAIASDRLVIRKWFE